MSSIFNTARGVKWSFCLEVQGFPWTYTDGVAAWTGKFGAPFIELPGTLASRDFQLKWLSNPQEPLETGGGLRFELVDDGTELLFRTWSKDHRGRSGYGRLGATLGAAVGDTTLTMLPGVGGALMPLDAYAFLGKETVRVTALPTPLTRTITRGHFSTLRDQHRVFDAVRPSYSTSPTVYEDRVCTLWAAPVDPLTGSLDPAEAIPIWGGIIKEARIKDERVHIECTPITKLLEDAWPAILPSGVLRTKDDQMTLLATNFSLAVTFGLTEETFTLRLGAYDGAGTFALLPVADTVMPIARYVKIIQDSIIYFADNDTRSPYAGGTYILRSNFSLSLQLNAEGTEWDVIPYLEAANGAWFAFGSPHWGTRRSFIVPGEGRPVRSIRVKSSMITPEQTTIVVKLDRPAYPFEVNWTWAIGVAARGYAIIGSKDAAEMILFRGVTIDAVDPLIATLTGVVRGVGGTRASLWGSADPEADKPEAGGDVVTIKQILMLTGALSPDSLSDLLPVSHIPLYLLLSTPDRSQNGTYDMLSGYRMGQVLPKRWVDVQAFEALARRHTLPLLSAFWVSEQTKGKDAIQETLKMAGIYLVERRFTDSDNAVQYGISVECIDLPIATQYNETFTDNDHESRGNGSTSHNERLVINNTKIKPFSQMGSKESKGEEVFVWDEFSIAEYDTSKALEFKPTALLGMYDNTFGGDVYKDREALVAWMFDVSYRWFAAYGRAGYSYEATGVAPTGYRYRIGQMLDTKITALRSSTGGKGLVGVGRIMKLEQSWGERASVNVGCQLSTEQFCELAPSATATVTGAFQLTLAPGTFANATDRQPFSYDLGAKEQMWFDVARHGANIGCSGWVRGAFPTTWAEFIVTATNLTTGVLTTSGNVQTLFGAAAVINLTLARHTGALSPLARLYAYTGDEQDKLSLGDFDNKEFS